MADSSTKLQILAVARALLEGEGASAVSMRRIADQVKITPMAIYKHYPDREAVLNAVADQGFEELAGTLDERRWRGGAIKQVVDRMEIYLEHAIANPHLFELMFLKPREGARKFPDDFVQRRSPTANLVADALAAGMEAGEIAKGDIWEIAFQLGALAQGLILLRLGGRVALSPEQFRKLYRKSITRFLHGPAS